MNFIKSIICFFAGHKPIKKVTKDNEYFWGSYCDRCEGVLGFPIHYKNSRKRIPPDYSKKAIQLWNDYLDQKELELRERIKNQA